jgi:T4 RnlA family RNA ligase
MFPVINHIDEVKAAIAGRDEFIIKTDEEHGYQVVNYMVALADTFPDPNEEGISEAEKTRRQILRECRGVTFHSETGRVVSRKLHKFHNIGERPETDPANIDWTQPHVILQKLDGSLATFYKFEDGFQVHTKMGMTGVAMPINHFVAGRSEYFRFAEFLYNSNMTGCFEWCSRKQRIVIDHPVDRLVLLAVRENVSGKYISHDIIKEWAASYGVECVEALPGSVENIQHFMEQVRDLEGEEGYVIAFDSGFRCKIKGIQYVRMHRAKDSLAHEKNVLFLVATDAIDDVIALLPEDDKKRVTEYAATINAHMLGAASMINYIVQEAEHLNQKDFAIDVAGKFVGNTKSLLFTVRKGEVAALEAIKKTVANACSSQSKVDSIRDLIGVRWDEAVTE